MSMHLGRLMLYEKATHNHKQMTDGLSGSLAFIVPMSQTYGV